MSIDPCAHVVRSEIAVILVELVPDQDRAFELRVELAAPLERGHRRRVVGLLNAQHSVVFVSHEAQDQLLDLRRQGLLRLIQRKVPEARQVNDLHVDTARRLDTYPNRFRLDVVSAFLVHNPDDSHHLVDRLLLPLLVRGVAHEPTRFDRRRHVAELEDSGPPATQGARYEVEGLTCQCLDEAALADRLLAKEDELGHGEVYDAQLVLHASLDIAKQV
mmetsp:Transcript_4301/g.10871  ORF Transcript_4301/g.10871 Transcript_4301/m.10871 type:complete len:218 (+) Transcript_4301:994-1647(+)